MKRMIAAAVAVLGLAAMASAQTSHGPIQGMAAPGCASCGAGHAGLGLGMPAGFGHGGGGCKDCDPRYGLNPFFQKLMFWKKDTACGTCGRLLGGCGGKNCAGVGAGAFNPYPNGVPGTLVYPFNPNIRSPRDWYEK